MRLVVRLVLAFVAVAALSVAVTGWLSFRAAETRIPRALAEPGVMRGAGPGGPADTAGLGARGQEVLSLQLREANLQAAAIALVVAAFVGAAVDASIVSTGISSRSSFSHSRWSDWRRSRGATVRATATPASRRRAATRSPSWAASSTPPPTGCRPRSAADGGSRATSRTSCAPR